MATASLRRNKNTGLCRGAATAATGLVDSYVGDETLSKCGVSTLKYLTEHGLDMNAHSFTVSAEKEFGRDIIESCTTLVWIATQSSNRLARRRPACSQTETSSLLAPNASVAVKTPADSTTLLSTPLHERDVDVR